ncbi:MAG TPA: hypothetical protein QF564_32105 [Pirellulaceae bacterium]|nr:hypothetical protein [Pirellulaceae bacterium]
MVDSETASGVERELIVQRIEAAYKCDDVPKTKTDDSWMGGDQGSDPT